MANRAQQERYLFLGYFFSATSGGHSVAQDLTSHLEKNGIQVTTASTQTSAIGRFVDMVWQTLRHRNRVNMAMIDVYSGRAFLWAAMTSWLLKQANVPILMVLRGGQLPEYAAAHPERVRRVLKRATHIVTVSQYLQQAFSDIRSDIANVYNGFQLGTYTYRHRQQARPKIAWLRSIHHIYNPVMAAQAINELRDEYPDIQLTMYGYDKKDGAYEALLAYIESENLSDFVRVPGAVPKADVPRVLNEHDIFINTTTAESFGVSVLEAGASGMCIVTTSVGELPYIWTNEENALLVDNNDANAMANAIRRLIEEPELAATLSANARQTAESFDWSAVLPQWEAILKQTREQRS